MKKKNRTFQNIRINNIDLEIDRTRGIVRVRIPEEHHWATTMKMVRGAVRVAESGTWEVNGDKEKIKEIARLFSRIKCRFRLSLIPGEKTNSGKRNGINGNGHCTAHFCQNMKKEGYSNSTILAYYGHISRFINNFYEKDINLLPGDNIREYIIDLVVDQHYSPIAQGQLINALQLYYKMEAGRELLPSDLPRPGKSRQIPMVLSHKEIQKILDAVTDLRHRTMLALICGTGLSLAELISLKKADVDLEGRLLMIRKNRSRTIPLLPELTLQIKAYSSIYSPQKYLFEGRKGGSCSPRTVQSIFGRALKKSGVKKNANIQTLRHSYASHMLSNGIELTRVRELLGLRSPRTADIYIHARTQD